MSAHATTVQTGSEGAHQIPSNDLSSSYYLPFLPAEYAPVQDPVTGEWYSNPMGVSGDELTELLQCGPGYYQSTLEDVLIEQRYEDRIAQESQELDDEGEADSDEEEE